MIVMTVKVAVRLFHAHDDVAQTSVCPRESAIRHKRVTINYFVSNALKTRDNLRNYASVCCEFCSLSPCECCSSQKFALRHIHENADSLTWSNVLFCTAKCTYQE